MNNPAQQRIASIDIFRGLVIIVMVFVNDAARINSLPWWTYHMPDGVDGLTYVDLVFPAFLFIVGMVIPIAIKKRLAQGQSYRSLWQHIIIRSLSLVGLGILIMNGRQMDPALTGIPYSVWNVAMLISAILFLQDYPKTGSAAELTRYRQLKGLGLIMLIILISLYRRRSGDEALWLDLHFWEILGIIGWCYLSVCLLWFLCRGNLAGLIICFVALNLLNIGVTTGTLEFIHQIPTPLWPFGNGGECSIVLAGTIFAKLFLEHKIAGTASAKIQLGLGCCLLLFIAGWLLLPFGLAKNQATPSWCLISIAISGVLFIGLYSFIDVAHISSWAKPIKPAGANPLLIYILPDIYYAIFSINHFADIAGSGWPGVLRAAIFTLFILAVGTLLTRLHIRLQL